MLLGRASPHPPIQLPPHMPFQVNIHGSMPALLEGNPEYCPVCLRGIHVVEVTSFVVGDWVERILRCPREQCGRVFIVRYKGAHNTPTGRLYHLNEMVPLTIRTSEHSEIIEQVSPDFVTIFAEAERAEQSGLKLICGPGTERRWSS